MFNCEVMEIRKNTEAQSSIREEVVRVGGGLRRAGAYIRSVRPQLHRRLQTYLKRRLAINIIARVDKF
jgi:hypothetical protein